MKNIKDLKDDKSLEPYFLDYVRSYEENEHTEEEDIAEGMSGEDEENMMRKPENLDIAFENLINKINNGYGTDYDVEEMEEGDEIASLLNECCEYYIEKYGIDYIISRPYEFIREPEEEISDIITENGINICDECNNKMEEKTFDELPEELKNEYKDIKDSVEYYFYCRICQEYNIIYRE